MDNELNSTKLQNKKPQRYAFFFTFPPHLLLEEKSKHASNLPTDIRCPKRTSLFSKILMSQRFFKTITFRTNQRRVQDPLISPLCIFVGCCCLATTCCLASWLVSYIRPECFFLYWLFCEILPSHH